MSFLRSISGDEAMQFAVITLLILTAIAFVAYVGTWVLAWREQRARRDAPPARPRVVRRQQRVRAPTRPPGLRRESSTRR
jgi:hypothetical protein